MPPSQFADTPDSPQGPQGLPPRIPAPPTHHDAPTVAADDTSRRRGATLTPLEYLAWRRARGERLARAWREQQARYEQEHARQRAQQRPLPAATPDDADDTPPDAAG